MRHPGPRPTSRNALKKWKRAMQRYRTALRIAERRASLAVAPDPPAVSARGEVVAFPPRSSRAHRRTPSPDGELAEVIQFRRSARAQS